MVPPKKKSRRVPSTHVMVSSAIKGLGNPKGSSYTAIKRYISSKYKAHFDTASLDEDLKEYLKKSVQCGKLIQTSGTGARGSFRMGTASPKEGRACGSSQLNLRREVAANVRKVPVLARKASEACTASRRSRSKRAHTTASKSQAKPKKSYARKNKEKSSSSTKKSKVSPKSVPWKEAYKFFLALVSGEAQQIKAFEDYLNTPFLISVPTSDSTNCRCVNGRLSEIQAMLSPLPLMKRLLERTCPGIKCTRNRIDGYETQPTSVKFYPLHVAAATGDLELVATILSKNPDMYISSSPAQYYPFELALQHGNHHVAQNLLDRGFSYKSPRNIRQYEQTKYCVRMDRVIAGAMDNSDLIPMLKIACLADVVLHNKEWLIAVRISLKDNDLPLLKNLLDRDVGDCSEIVVQKDKCVLSLAKCADAVNMIFDQGFVPERFLEARREKCLEKGKTCWPKPEFNEETETILHQIIREERFDIAEAVIKNCPELMAEVGVSKECHLFTSPPYDTIMKPLHMCALRCDYDGLKLLIKNGANVNELSTGVDRRSILHYLCFSSCSIIRKTKCFNLIVENGFTSLDLRDKFGCTALFYASGSYNMPLLNLLLANGADPTITRKSHFTVLGNLAERNEQTNRFSVILPVLYSNVPEHCMTTQETVVNPEEKATPQVISLAREDIPSVRAFIESGWFIHEALIKEPKAEQCLRTWSAKNLDWIQDVHLSSVPSLQWWSKRAIRKILPLFPSKIVQELTLPEPMKKYIMKVDDLPPKETEMLENFEWLPHESDEEKLPDDDDDEDESGSEDSCSSSSSWNSSFGYDYDYDERPYWS